MDVPDHLFWTSLLVGLGFRALGGCRCDSGFVVEAVQVASGFLEVLDPSLRLDGWKSSAQVSQAQWVGNASCTRTYLSDHHMAVECAFSPGGFRSVDMRAYFGHHRRSESHIWNKVAVHDINLKLDVSLWRILHMPRGTHMQPVSSILYRVRACGA